MDTRYLVDTNAISDYLGAKISTKALDFMDSVMDDSPTISVINRIELLGHNRPELTKFQIAVEGCHIFELTESIVLKTIALRKSRSIKLPDAIIAATALVHDLTLITHNTADFKNIPSIKLLDLWTL